MTKEEAIYFANCLKNNYTVDLNDMEAFCDEAIKALEQRSITKDDSGVNCVSRKEVEKLVYRFLREGTDENIAFYEHLLDLPSVTPQPRKGHWKLVQRGKVIDVCCSNCEAVRIKEWAYNYTIDELNKEDINECFGSAEMRFCPNCDADMGEVENDTD